MTADTHAAVDVVDAEVVLLIDALAAAYVTYQLYPKAAEQPIFVRAVETIRSTPHLPIRIEVGPGTFVFQMSMVVATRDGAERLAKRLFVHDVGAIELLGAIEATDLVHMFDVIARDVEEVEREGGPYLALMNLGVDGVRLLARSMTEPDEDEELEERDRRVSSLLEVSVDPEAIAANLVEEESDEDRIAERFIAWYLDVYSRVGEADFAGREQVVKAFVESFFYFEQSQQVRLLERFLKQKDDEPCQVFLDQFAGHELVALSSQLDPESQGRLTQYARISHDAADDRPEELLALLQSAQEVKEARAAVARRVQSLIGSEEPGRQEDSEWYQSLRAAIPTTDMHDGVGFAVMRSLLACETRDHRFQRLLRVWSGKVALAIRNGRLRDAVRWVDAVLTEPPYPPDKDAAVRNALVSMATPDVLEHLVVALQEVHDEEAAAELLDFWGHTIAGRLMERLAQEEDPARRRVLIDLLGSIGRLDPAPLYDFLSDERWYVLRNLAVILSRSGRPEVAARVGSLASHDDHRVRVEALRALALLTADSGFSASVEALADSHPRVRQAALTLLRSSRDPRVDPVLLDTLKKARAPDDVRRVMEVLAARDGDVVREAIRRNATKKIALTALSRSRRDAARDAMRKAER